LMDIVSDGLVCLLGRQNLHISYNPVAQPPDPSRARLYELFHVSNTFDFFDSDGLVLSVRAHPQIARDWISRTSKPGNVVVVDGEDDGTVRAEFQGLAKVYFKRELTKLTGNLKPLPFGAFPEEFQENVERTNRVVFRGAMDRTELRSKVYQHLKAIGLNQGDGLLGKKEYNTVLRSSQIGVSVKGAGWDTYRYWETAYFGCALLSERLPILIPGNFVHGLEAVFFNGFQEFVTILDGLLGDGEVVRRLGENARKACLARHMSTHRAATVLEHVLS
jgi:hypothetical protein